jgi:hypothetical protein
MSVADAWNEAAAAAPTSWHVQGLRCTSRGLAPELRGDRWVAEACGPDDACILIEDDDPERALRQLADRLFSEARPADVS